MAEYKGKLLKGLFTRATKCLMSDGSTDVESLLDYGTQSTDSGAIKYTKCGGLVTITFTGFTLSNSATITNKIPQDFRPVSSQAITVSQYNGENDTRVVAVDVNPNGSMTFYVKETISSRAPLTNGTVYGTGCYQKLI